MIRFLPILSNVISEQKRYQMNPDTRSKLQNLSDNLWSIRNKNFLKKTMVDELTFKTADGSDGLVKVFVNPKYPNLGELSFLPKRSNNPMNLVVQVNPKYFDSKKNLFLTLYHEMMHAIDPNFTTRYNENFWDTYDIKKDETYWGHPIEFFATTNEFLEGLVNEYTRRVSRTKNPENLNILVKSLNNILNYFSKGEKLSKLSLDVLFRINDEYVNSNKISNLLANISTDYPNVTELIPNKDDIPYYLHYIQLIKKFNPKIWPRFLTMLYKTKDEIEDIINKKRG